MSELPFGAITAERLEAYDRRQRALKALRGLGWTVCAASLLLFVGVVLDWLIVVPDAWRWALAILGYAIVFGVAFLFCLRPALSPFDVRGTAVEIEQIEPALRNRLLSAIELHSAEGASAGSPRLREISQAKVDYQIQSLELKRVLPAGRLIRVSTYAFAAVALLGLMTLVPGFDFQQRLARVLMPGANLGRIANTHIWIRSPEPASGTVPANETTSITAQVSGTPPDQVEIEIRDKRTVRRQTMHLIDIHQYAVNVPVDTEPIEYRIHAGKGYTAWHTLEPKPRPSIVAFQQSIRHPSYTQLPTSVRKVIHGDIEALAGSLATIEMKASAPLKSAKLTVQWEGKEPLPQQLEQLAEDRYRIRFPINQAGSYSVELIDAETGFDNPFLPLYRISALEDLPPQIAFADPPRDPLLLPSHDVVRFQLHAEDELPLGSIGYEVAINGADWKRQQLELPEIDGLAAPPGLEAKNASVVHDLDLLPFALSVGDSVQLRGYAIDRKGQVAFSPPMELVIDSAHDGSEIRESVLGRLAWADSIGEWASAVRESCDAAIAEIKSVSADESFTVDDLDTTIDSGLLETGIEKSEAAFRESIELLTETKRSFAASQLEHVARMVDRVQAALQEVRFKTQQGVLVAEERPLEQLSKELERIAEDAKRTKDAADYFIGFDLDLAYTAELYGMLELLDAAEPGSAAGAGMIRLQRYATVISNRLKAFDLLLAETIGYFPERSRHSVANLRNWVGEHAFRLNRVLDEGGDMEESKQQEELRQVLAETRRQFASKTNTATQDGQLHQHSLAGLRDLGRRAGVLHPQIEELAVQMSRLSESEGELLAAKDPLATEQAEAERERRLAVVGWSANVVPTRLRRWATLHQLRIDADARYAADSELTSRAIQAVLRVTEESSILSPDDDAPESRAEVVKAIADDYEILEAGHQVAQVLLALDELIRWEQWNDDPVTRRFVLPLRWEHHLLAVEDAATALRNAGVEAEIRDAINRTRWEPPQNVISQNVLRRRWDVESDATAFHEMQEVRERLSAADAQLQPIMEAARLRIAAYVPSIPQLAENAAEALRGEIQIEDPAGEDKSPTSAEDAKTADAHREEGDSSRQDHVADRHENFEQKMKQLLDALVQHANLADLATLAGIQQARDADAAVDALKSAEQKLASARQEAAMRENAREEQRPGATQSQAETELNAAEQHTLELLRAVQQHFANASPATQPPAADPAATREPLLAAQRDAGLQRAADAKFEPITRLASADQYSPHDLLQALEAELERNAAMQEELSDISQAAVERTRNTLTAAAEKQQEMQRGIESADSQFLDTKRAIVRPLREAADQTAEMEHSLMQQAQNAAGTSQHPQLANQLGQVREQLKTTAAELRRLNDQTLMADIAETANANAEALAKASRDIEAAGAVAAAKQNDAIFEEDRNRDSLATTLKRNLQRMRDSRIRDAQNRLRGAQRETDAASRTVRDRERDLNRHQTEVRKQEQLAKNDPENENRKRAVARAVQEKQLAELRLQHAKEIESVALEKRKWREAYLEEAKATPQPNLSAANPAAEAVSELSAHAAELAERLKEVMRAAGQAAGQDLTPRPPENHLQSADDGQQVVQQQVANGAGDLARAARHEKRLGKREQSEILAAHSEQVAAAAANEVSAAGKRLKDASAATHSRDEQPAAAENATEVPKPSIPVQMNAAAAADQAVQDALNSLEQSEFVLRARAQDLDGITEDRLASAAAGQGSVPAQSSPRSASANSQAEHPALAGITDPRLLAETLDQLDQQVAAESRTPSGQSTAEPGSATSTAANSFASRLQSEARKLGRQLAQQRTAANQLTASPSSEDSPLPAGLISGSAASTDAFAGSSELERVDRSNGADWGALESLTIEDAADSGTAPFQRAYRSQIEAYFRVLAERSRKSDVPAR